MAWISNRKQWWVDFILKILNSISNICLKFTIKMKSRKCTEICSKYDFFAPKDDCEGIEHYSEMLQYSLANDKPRNIAVAGPYGSGKSSFLQSFFKENHHNVLWLSLASFNDADEGAGNGEGDDASNIPAPFKGYPTQLIELSILQQIFYHAKPQEIPFSRFKKIHNVKPIAILVKALFLLAFCLSLIGVFQPKILWVHYDWGKRARDLIFNISLVVIIFTLFFLLVGIVKAFIRSRLTKFNLKDVELEMGDQEETSILNRHLDEILYFFESTKYEIVVIEDLDRFNQVGIFTKLREINLLLNNSKQISRKIIFIYALRDDILCHKERMKFFDIIIPIIPIINISNSKELLLRKLKDMESKPDDKFVQKIAIYIDEMRLLRGICNEFIIYQSILGKELPANNLFAMIVYKNLFPKDFAEIYYGRGQLVEIFHNKNDFISQKILEREKEINLLTKEIENLENQNLKNITELNFVYSHAIRAIKDRNIMGVYNGDELVDINQCDEKIWDQLLSQKHLKYRHLSQQYSGYRTQDEQIATADLEKFIHGNSGSTYQIRKKHILGATRSNVEFLKQNILDIRAEISELQAMPLSRLLKEYDSKDILDGMDNPLLAFLLRNAYIDERYYTYMSFFHEGTMTRTDNEFMLSVMNNKALKPAHQLNEIGSIINELDLFDFSTKPILNLHLLSFFLNNPNNHSDKMNRFYDFVCAPEQASIDFIDQAFSSVLIDKVKFIQIICERWPDFWQYISAASNYPQERKNFYLAYILQHSMSSIGKININNSLNEYLEDFDGLIPFIQDNNLSEVFSSLIEKLDLKFSNFSIPPNGEGSKLINIIYDSNAYVINIPMLSMMVQHRLLDNYDDSAFKNKNYTLLHNPILESLLSYIEDNIQEYIDDVYAGLEDQQEENEEYILAILNNDSISIESRKKFIEKQVRKVSEIGEIKDEMMLAYIVRHSYMKPNIENIFEYYLRSEKKVTDDMIVFLNENFTEIPQKKMFEVNDGNLSRENVISFYENILTNEKISNSCIKVLQKISPYHWNSLDLEKSSSERITVILEGYGFGLNNHNFTILKAKIPNGHITLVEQRIAKLEDLDGITLDDNDIRLLLNANIQDAIKIALIKKEEARITPSGLLCKACVPIFQRHINEQWSQKILSAIIRESNDYLFGIKLILAHKARFDIAVITQFIKNLPAHFNALAEPGRRPPLPADPIVYDFLEFLKSINLVNTYHDITTKNGKRIRANTKNK